MYLYYIHIKTHTGAYTWWEEWREREEWEQEKKSDFDIWKHSTTDCDYTITHNLNTVQFSFILIGFLLSLFFILPQCTIENQSIDWIDSIFSTKSNDDKQQNARIHWMEIGSPVMCEFIRTLIAHTANGIQSSSFFQLTTK